MTNTTKPPTILNLDKNDVVEPVGVVEDAISRKVEEPSTAESWKYLAPGSSMAVPAGSAYYIKTKEKWFLSQFFDKGRMFGPLVFSETSIETPVKALREKKKENGEFQDRLAVSSFLAAFAPIFLFAFTCLPPPVSSYSNTAFVFITSAILLLISYASVRPIIPVLLDQNSKVLSIIKDKFSYSRESFSPPSKPLPVVGNEY
ncbi:hypothetical protein [Sulfitobacter sp. R18_1]|uniref:hypothetical protein n=1 Tax=Sulfitobacter sp. R18_1 TaxID=2821104 RepID=UPI001ADAFA98|nr:hypothetical protein [Sulfitobacter sp. R18_1]MBO9428160.1 hypothetical protein [Sulfitobacter sp. R18_1]